jgi:hypothetical protein
MPDPHVDFETACEAATQAELRALHEARRARWLAIMGDAAGTADGIRRLADAGEISPSHAATLCAVMDARQ